METKDKCVAQTMAKDTSNFITPIIWFLLTIVGLIIIGKISAYFGFFLSSTKHLSKPDLILAYFGAGGAIACFAFIGFAIFFIIYNLFDAWRESAKERCK